MKPRRSRHKVIGFVDAATMMDGRMIRVKKPPQGHWLRGCRDARNGTGCVVGVKTATRSLASWMPRLKGFFGLGPDRHNRHKVIGFVDAATTVKGAAEYVKILRHKVIGFVDAATRRAVRRFDEHVPPQGHWLRGCRD